MLRQETSPEEELIRLLRTHHLMIATAESCTGGLAAASLVNVPGASDVFHEGYITYEDEVKHRLLGVSRETIDNFTVVSAPCAAEMCEGAARKAGADAALSVTGIAGPGGGTKEIPVGTVFIGCYTKKGGAKVRECHFDGDRKAVRESAAREAIRFAASCIREDYEQQ